MYKKCIIALGFALGFYLYAMVCVPHRISYIYAEKESIPTIVASTSTKQDLWAQVPIALRKIAACESSYEHKPYAKPRQFEPDGKTVRWGRIHTADTGAFQINLEVHAREANRLGMDVKTEAGNIAYALYLYRREGTVPWNSSKGCWGKA